MLDEKYVESVHVNFLVKAFMDDWKRWVLRIST